ncbi:MAG TPA: ATP-binding protein [Polyangiaceae bacterium]|nr:ATP-binding protein [Polyangiaceae bacterium]
MQHPVPDRSSPSVRPGPPPATPADSGSLRMLEIIDAGASQTDPQARPPEAEAERKPRRSLSIFQKLLLLILALVLGLVSILAFYLLSRQVAEMHDGLESKAAAYGRLVSKQVESAIAFDDRETAREVFDSVAQDADVESLTLFTAKGSVLRAFGTISADSSELAKNVTAQTLIARADRIVVAAPVVSLEGPRGTLVVELSTRRLVESATAAQRRAGLAFVLAALLGAAGALSIARPLARRLEAIAGSANAVARGDLNVKPVDDQRTDEIGVMVTAFNSMLRQIRGLVQHIKKAAREEQVRLERLVAERTAELDNRNADMRRVLDNVGQGFLTLDRECQMSRERSRVLETWFGKAPESGSFIDYLAQLDAHVAEWFQLGWDAVVEDMLPLEVTLDQLPKRLALGGRHFELEYRPILNAEGKLERTLLVLSDVTAVLERERAEADEREVTRLFTRIVADRAGCLEFFAEAQALVDEIRAASSEPERVKRPLHTLKGNTAIYGIDSVARLCHRLETSLAESGTVSEAEIAELVVRWGELTRKVKALVGDSSGKLEIDEADYQHVLAVIDGHAPHTEIQGLIRAWRLESTETRLRRIAEQAEGLAIRLEKGPIQVEIESNQLRLKPEQWSEFWAAAIHVIRNSVDHGLETPEERARSGKAARATLWLRTSLNERQFSIEFADDGRGIDWARVAEKAKARGLAAATHSDLVEALFADGLSTREAVTEHSGRGVGLSAIRAACRKLGGKVEVESQPNKGSLFRFIWPAAVVTASGTRLGRSVPAPASKGSRS